MENMVGFDANKEVKSSAICSLLLEFRKRIPLSYSVLLYSMKISGYENTKTW